MRGKQSVTASVLLFLFFLPTKDRAALFGGDQEKRRQ
jgi:hypothetical protein